MISRQAMNTSKQDEFKILDGVRYELVKDRQKTFLLEREGKLYTWHKKKRERVFVGYVKEKETKSNQKYYRR